jgi:hypothetical protein
MNQTSSKLKLKIGAVIMVVGFLSPLLIPVVVASNLSASVKTVISGLLAFGIPEIFMLLAVVVMGKQGFEYIKNKVKTFLKRLAPSGSVSRTRYRIGLVLFCLPIIMGVLSPYLIYMSDFFKDMPLWFHSGFDLLFLISLFVLGGDFWNKLNGLFYYDSEITKTQDIN